MMSLSAIAKRVRRLERRMRDGGVRGPIIVAQRGSRATVVAGGRVVDLDDEGNTVPQLRPVWMDAVFEFDPQGLTALRNRHHAMFLSVAADYRRRGERNACRAMVDCARCERTQS